MTSHERIGNLMGASGGTYRQWYQAGMATYGSIEQQHLYVNGNVHILPPMPADAPTPNRKFKTIREEMQADVDAWLKDVV